MPTFTLQHFQLNVRRRWVKFIFLIWLIALQLPVQAQHLNKIQKLLTPTSLKKRAAVDSPIAGNEAYEIVLEDQLGNGVGLFTVRTGWNHPINNDFDGVQQGLLGGGSTGEVGTNYITVRSYSSTTDYVQSEFIENAPGFKTAWLDTLLAQTNNFAPVQPIKNTTGNTTGYEVIYDLPGEPQTPDKMRITTRTEVHGTNFDDSWVEITTIVENTGNSPLKIGVRYLLDLKIGEDDGAEVIETALGTGFGKTEKEFKRLNFAYLRAAANDTIRNLTPPGYYVYGSVITPHNLLRVPDQPTLLQQVSWPLAFLKPFVYKVDSNLTITKDVAITDPANRTGGDNAILYFWGEAAENGFTIDPGQKVQVTQGFLAGPREVLPPLYDRTPPTCTFKVRGNRAKGFFSDEESGIAEIKPLSLHGAKLKVDPFKPGDKKVNFRLKRRENDEDDDEDDDDDDDDDDDSFIRFSIKITDLNGNSHVCDHVRSHLSADRDNRHYTLKFHRVDQYLTLENRGLSEIRVDLNGHRFGFYANSNNGSEAARLRNAYRMPSEGSLTIDLQPYLRGEENIMQLEIAGPPRTSASLLLIDAAPQIDHPLALVPIPQNFALSQNLPNPFHGATTIHFEVPALESNVPRVDLKIYNVLGQLVRTLVDADLPSGSYRQVWDGRDEAGREVAAGVYLYNLNAGDIQLTKKMVLIR